MRAFAACLLVLLLAVGCASPTETLDALTPGTPLPTMRPTDPTRTPTAMPTGAAAPTPTVPATALPPELLGLPEVEQARADLALRLNVPPEDIEIVEVQEVEWTDTSMGCPQPGVDYLQVVTPGLLIRLNYAGQTYAYHSGGGQPPFLCEQSFPG